MTEYFLFFACIKHKDVSLNKKVSRSRHLKHLCNKWLRVIATFGSVLAWPSGYGQADMFHDSTKFSRTCCPLKACLTANDFIIVSKQRRCLASTQACKIPPLRGNFIPYHGSYFPSRIAELQGNSSQVTLFRIIHLAYLRTL